MSKRSGLTAVILSFALLSAISAVGSPVDRNTVAPPDPATMSPSDMHRYMALQKALNLERSRAMQQAALADGSGASQTEYDVTMYEVDIRVDDTTEWLDGSVRVDFNSTVQGLTSIDLDLYSNMTVDSVVGPSGLISSSHSGNSVLIGLGTTINAGDPFSLVIYYQGHPVEGGLQAFEFGWHNGERSISSLSEPYFARTWWPCKDHMDDKPDSFKIHVEVDTALYCASNGTLDSITPATANSRTFHYTEHHPMATYLFSVAIAPYVVWEQVYPYNTLQDTMPIVHHVYSDWDSYSRSTWGKTPDIMNKLSATFGDYPFLDEKYGHANFEWGGGMEHQTCTSMLGGTFGFATTVVAHEMGHQWWGDMITCASWHDIWLNEGWASYAEAVYYLAGSGWNTYHSYMRGMAYWGGGTVYCDDTTDIYRIFDPGLSYDKGAWVCHMLRGVVGEDGFAAGIDAYYHSEFQYAAATTEDFKNVFETATGMELDWFFDEWVHGQYFPKYRYYFMDEPSDSGGYDIYLMVKQVQTTSPQVFHMPVDFYFDEPSGPGDTLTLVPDARRKLFKLNRVQGVDDIKFDPADWVLDSSYALPWQMFVITESTELSGGVKGLAYEDTVEYRGGSGDNLVTIASGALPPGLTIDNAGVIFGNPTDTGTYTFAVNFADQVNGYTDQTELSIHIASATCCIPPTVGDINQSGDIDITDISVLIDNQFLTLTPLVCSDEADIDYNGEIDITDLSLLIDNQFLTLTPLGPCP